MAKYSAQGPGAARVVVLLGLACSLVCAVAHDHCHAHGATGSKLEGSHSCGNADFDGGHKADPALDPVQHPFSAFMMTFTAGMMSTVGGAAVVLFGVPSDKLLGGLLSFACGIMLYISYADMLPHSFEELGWFAANQWFMLGMAFFGVVVWLVPEPDVAVLEAPPSPPLASPETTVVRKAPPTPMTTPAPRGRARSVGRRQPDPPLPPSPSSPPPVQAPAPPSSPPPVRSKSRLYMTGLIAAAGISLHNFPEGLIVFSQSLTGVCSEDISSLTLAGAGGIAPFLAALTKACAGRGLALFLAISLHNIPEGMAVASPIFAATGSAWHAMKWCVLSSLCEPLAAALLIPVAAALTTYWAAVLNAFVAGVMVMLCIVELVPTAAAYSGAQAAGAWHLVGQAVMFVSLHAMIQAGLH